MPRYVYECQKCGSSHDEFHSMSEDPLIKCSKCKAKCFRAIQPIRPLIRGNCYLNKTDCKAQAALSTLQDSDPYARHRQPGEKDELISQLKNKNKAKKSIKVK